MEKKLRNVQVTTHKNMKVMLKQKAGKEISLHHEQLSSIASWNLLSYVAGSPNSQRLNLERPELSDEFLAGRWLLTSWDGGSCCGCRVLFVGVCWIRGWESMDVGADGAIDGSFFICKFKEIRRFWVIRETSSHAFI